MTCPKCGLPMVASTERNIVWCCVWGRHPERRRSLPAAEPRCAYPDSPGAPLIDAIMRHDRHPASDRRHDWYERNPQPHRARLRAVS